MPAGRADDPAAHAGFDPDLRVDWLDAGHFADGRPGRLGLTVLPGKRGPSVRYPGRVYRRDVDADLATLREMGVRRLILLVEDDELERWSDLAIVERGTAADVEVIRHPIPDGTPPTHDLALRMVEEIATGRDTGDVALACMGGVGRSGTVAACALISAGWSAARAVGLVRDVRHPLAVETIDQERFVAAFGRAAGTAR